MRSTLLAVCAILLFSAVLASPAKGTKGTNTACTQFCSDFNAICATPKSGTGPNLSFGSKCVLDKYNCEHPSAPYVYKADGECPGGQGIRLQ